MAISTSVQAENSAAPANVTAEQKALTDVISALAAFASSGALQEKVNAAENLKHAACYLAEATHRALQRAELDIAVEALKTQGFVQIESVARSMMEWAGHAGNGSPATRGIAPGGASS